MSKPEGQVAGQGGPHASLLPLPQPPSWPPRDADGKGFQGLSPAVDADVQGRD